MNKLKRAVQQFNKREDDVIDWESELNPYKQDTLRLIKGLSDSNVDVQEESIRKMGHTAFTGGLEASKCAGNCIPKLLAMLAGRANSLHFRVTILKALSEICHQNKENQEKIRRNEGLKLLADLIGETTSVKLSRWACYTLNVMMADNIPVMREILELPNIWEALCFAAEYPRPWDGWPVNIAYFNLKLLGIEKGF